MSKHSKPHFRYKRWTLNDTDKKLFLAQAALDTYVERLLWKLDDFVIAGGDVFVGIKRVFSDFEWFVNKADNAVKLCGGHHHFNYVLLSEVLTNKLEVDYFIQAVVHYDGSTESTGQ
jgi:hypothetical protein